MGVDRSDMIPIRDLIPSSCQSGSNLCDRTDPDYITAAGRETSLDELPGGGKCGRIRSNILGRDFVRHFDVTIDLNDGLIRIKDPERKYEKKPLNKILINQAKVPIFLNRKVRLKANQAVVATFRMGNLYELSNDRQVCQVPNPNSKSSAILGRNFSLTQSGLCVSVLLNTKATTVTIQRGKETWLRIASAHRLSECGELEKV